MWLTFFLLLGFLLLTSAFFSGTEAAFFSLTRLHLRRLERDGRRRSRSVLHVLSRPGDLLTTVLVGNTLVNVAISAVATAVLLNRLGARGVEVAVGLCSLAVLFFGEVAPKTVAVNFPEAACRSAVDGYRLARVLLAPLVAVVSSLANLILKGLGLGLLPLSEDRRLSRMELGSLLEGADEEGVMTARETQLVQNILGFPNTTAEEVMTPRVDMIAAPEDLEPERLEELVAGAKHSRIPVYRGTIDEIIGYLPVRDFLLSPETRLGELIRPVAVFPERARASRIFYEIQKNRTPMVIVVNEYGETVGLLTREDLIEELVGDIFDEFEAGGQEIQRLGPGSYRALGRANLEELGETLSREFPDEDAVTLNGFLTRIHGGIPRKGEEIRWGGLVFTVEEVARHRIQRCFIEAPAPEPPATGKGDA